MTKPKFITPVLKDSRRESIFKNKMTNAREKYSLYEEAQREIDSKVKDNMNDLAEPMKGAPLSMSPMKRPSNSNMNQDGAEDLFQIKPIGRPSRDSESWTAS